LARDGRDPGRLRGLALPAAILLFAAAIRLAWSAENQTLWPDEAVYLLTAKSFAGMADYEVPASRSILLPLLWSLLYRIGLEERAIRATGVAFSLLSVHLLWRIGRRLHGDAVALGASFFLAVFWLDVFLCERFLTDGPALALWLLVLLVLFRSQLAPDGRGTLWLGPTVALLLLLRLGSAVLLPVLLVLLAVARGPAAVRDARLWKSAALGALVLLPYLLWCSLHHGSPFAPLLEMEAAVSPTYAAQVAQVYPRGLRAYLGWFPTLYLDPALCAVLAVGVLVAARGLLLARRGADRRPEALLLAWLASTPLACAALVGHDEARFLLPVFPAVFLLMSRGLSVVSLAAARRSRLAAAALLALPLAWAAHQQLASTAGWMRHHSRSYWAGRVVGTWLREHAEAGATVYAAAPEISQYYSDRRARWYPTTLEAFEGELRRTGATYLVVERGSALQPAWLEPWLATRILAPRFVYPRAQEPVEVYALPGAPAPAPPGRGARGDPTEP
jgi:4-amino-4-deoxy-L-arabinose transferase-like glycosyltransferase